jgi:hypothetical protein
VSFLTVSYRYHYHFKPGTQQVYKVLQLAVGLVVDLGLDRSPKSNKIAIEIIHHRREDSRRNCDASCTYDGSPCGYHTGVHLLDEERALAGCFYLSSTYISPGRALS